MALKQQRKYDEGTDVTYFMNVVGQAGIVVTHDTTVTGVASMDDPNNRVIIPTGTDGTPVGILLNDVVNTDLSRYHRNFHKNEVPVCSKVAILRNGWVYTDRIATGVSPEAGNPAHYTTDGLLTTATTSIQVGRFMTAPDSDGYVKVDVTIGS